MRLAFLFLVGLLGSQASAQVSLERELMMEQILEQRYQTYLRDFDPTLKVQVDVSVRESYIDLSGLGIEVNGNELPNQPLRESSIERVSVHIRSRLASMPDHLNVQLKRIGKIGKRDPVIVWEKWPDAVNDAFLKQANLPDAWRELAQGGVDSFLETSGKFLRLFMAGAATAALGLILLLWMIQRFTSILSSSAASIGDALKSSVADRSAKEKDEDAEGAVDAKRPSLAPAPELEGNFELSGMPTAAAQLLFDCYWCARDGYAHWIWKNMGPADRSEVISKYPLLGDYARHFCTIHPEPAGYHSNPYYLKAKDFSKCSQEDLATALKENPGLWSEISPMRREALNVGLKEKLQLMAAPKGHSTFEIPVSAPRELPLSASFGHVSEEDEAELLANPETLSPEMRGQVPSLVWLALQPQERAREILAKFNAQELAQAWVGHPDVLAALTACMPEKKSSLVASYAKRLRPSRQSETFRALHRLSTREIVNDSIDRAA